MSEDQQQQCIKFLCSGLFLPHRTQQKTDSNKKADVTKEADKTTKKSKVSGRTIGDPVLSDKAQKVL